MDMYNSQAETNDISGPESRLPNYTFHFTNIKKSGILFSEKAQVND